jgi:hypothetical protein
MARGSYVLKLAGISLFLEAILLKIKPAFFVVLHLLILSMLACSLGTMDFFSGSQLPPDVLFQDDFSDSSSGWDQQTSPEFETGYQDDGYAISIKAAFTMAWAKPGLSFSDVVLAADATQTEGTDDNSFGLLCRYTETETLASFYFIVISSDGFYGIGKVVDGRQELISSAYMEYNSAILQGDLTNHLQADCVGNQLVLRVNGQELAEAMDDTLTSGDVGLVAGAFSTPGADILFDNFVVKKPEEKNTTP